MIPDQKHTFYATRTSIFELRQTRFRGQRRTRNGEGHPHDVCAVATTRAELERMVADHFAGDCDWSELNAQCPHGEPLGKCADCDREHQAATA